MVGLASGSLILEVFFFVAGRFKVRELFKLTRKHMILNLIFLFYKLLFFYSYFYPSFNLPRNQGADAKSSSGNHRPTVLPQGSHGR